MKERSLQLPEEAGHRIPVEAPWGRGGMVCALQEGDGDHRRCHADLQTSSGQGHPEVLQHVHFQEKRQSHRQVFSMLMCRFILSDGKSM